MPDVVRDVWSHRVVGPVLRVLLVYVVAIEGITQLVFGRISAGPLDIGLQSTPTPRYIFINGALIGLLYGLLGMGLILVYRANRIVNFAQGSLGGLAAILAACLLAGPHVPFFISVLIGLAAAATAAAVAIIYLIAATTAHLPPFGTATLAPSSPAPATTAPASTGPRPSPAAASGLRPATAPPCRR